MNMFVIILFVLLLPLSANATVLQATTTWSGNISLSEDLLIPEGVTLTITPGTVVRVTPAESTKTDPEFLSPLPEIIVRGTLRANGTAEQPVVFSSSAGKASSWAGIIVDGGEVGLRGAVVCDAESGVQVFAGALSVSKSKLTGNRYGLAVQGAGSRASIDTTTITDNDFGLLLLNGARVDQRDLSVRGNRKKDVYAAESRDLRPPVPSFQPAVAEGGRVYGDEVILGTVVWQKRVEVKGIVRVPERSRLIILPGTVVEFRKKDTNGDGIGENGLLVQGFLIAKGTREKPIVFRSAEKNRRPGDWDSLNIMNSDTAQNLIEYCQIEDAYRGLHFHFSNVAVADSVIRNSYRGIQFQESVVSITRTSIYGNKSGVQARDSEIVFSDNVVYRNYIGMNVLRNNITITGNLIMNNETDGLRLREGTPVVEANDVEGNRHGLTVSDALYGSYSANIISHNIESGILLRNATGVEISANVVQVNAINGMSIQNSSAVIRENLISDNGERGIGIQSFQGAITANTITGNHVYNIGLDGEGDVAASGNWWGGDDLSKTIFDREDDPAKGRVTVLPVLERPALVSWPAKTVYADAIWRGGIAVTGRITVLQGAQLDIAPSTEVRLSPKAGISVFGRIVAKGRPDAPVDFRALNGKGPGVWDEIIIDHAPGSIIAYSRFRNATWALHSHFTNLKIDHCVFSDNYGGLRFTSGPIEVRHSVFTGNEIGIRDFRGNVVIMDNAITENRIGIFVREKGGGAAIRRNNLFKNEEYNVRIGDFNDEDVDARDNWWGGGAPGATIYDASTEPGIGFVRFEPYAKTRFLIEQPFAASLREDGKK